MNKLDLLISKCKCSVFITINDHKSYYTEIKNFLEKHLDSSDIDKDVYNKIIEKDFIVEIIFYPDTPVGSYRVMHYDVDKALDEALKCLESY